MPPGANPGQDHGARTPCGGPGRDGPLPRRGAGSGLVLHDRLAVVVGVVTEAVTEAVTGVAFDVLPGGLFGALFGGLPGGLFGGPFGGLGAARLERRRPDLGTPGDRPGHGIDDPGQHR